MATLFVDQAEVTLQAGNGGRGCTAMTQPPYIRYPYPDGGDGGDGGSISVRADPNIATLLDFHFRHLFKAPSGAHGGSNKKTGRRGESVVIGVPVGTVIHDAATGEVLRDLDEAGSEVVIARGGRGGYGNAAVDEAQPGKPGEERTVVLELKLIADVGLVGFPNAGKSSLLARISTARPKIAAYPFTTRYPVLGVVKVGDWGSFVACDIPGLIEGAHEGKGLGMQFLRHIERTGLLVHVVDLAATDGRDPVDAFQQLNHELASYSPTLPKKPQLVAANKMDVTEGRANLARFREAVGQPVYPISASTGEGVPALILAMWEALQAAKAAAASTTGDPAGSADA